MYSCGALKLSVFPRVPRGGAPKCETTSTATQGHWEGPKRSGVAGLAKQVSVEVSWAFLGQETHSHCPWGRARALKETGLP